MKTTKPPSPPKKQIQTRRIFSEEMKKRIVHDLEQNVITVSDIHREYHVTRAAVYKWLYRYSNHLRKGICQVVEHESEKYKTQALKKRIAELEGILGRKQLQIDVLEKTLELGSAELGIDIKKKFASTSSNGFESTETSIIIV